MKTAVIALNTFREAIRDKLLLVLVIFGFLLMASSKIIKPLAVGEEAKIIKDLGLASIALIMTLIAILVGGRLVYKEIDKRTIYIILSKPIYRFQLLLGKYLGLMFVIFLSIVIMTGGYYVVLYFTQTQANLHLLLSVLLTYFQVSIITGLAIFFSTFVTPIASSIFTFFIYFIGHLTRDLKALAAISKSPIVKIVAEFFYYLLPNLSNFNIKGPLVHDVLINYSIIYWAILYSLLYTGALLFLASLIFRQKEF